MRAYTFCTNLPDLSSKGFISKRRSAQEVRQSMSQILCKGFIIQPTPYRLADSGQWMIRVHIRRDTGDSIMTIPFSAQNTFETEDKVYGIRLSSAGRL
jgi:hypothetical protein